MRMGGFALAAPLAASCGLSGELVSGPGDPLAGLASPARAAVSPTQLALGDVIQVIGEDFVEPGEGTLEVLFAGDYLEEDGTSRRIQRSLPLRLLEPGLATLDFGPTVIFSEHGDRIGTFRGTAQVANRTATAQRLSDPLDLELQVLPSILVTELRTRDVPCAEVTEGTVAGASIALGVRAIGLAAADGAPITFHVSFTSPEIRAELRQEDGLVAAPDGAVTLTREVTAGDQLRLDPATEEASVEVDGMPDRVALHRLWAGQPAGPGVMTPSFLVEASAPDGTRARRAIPWTIRMPALVEPFTGTPRLVQRTEPEPTTGCIPGGEIGRDLAYSEQSTLTRTRSITLRWSESVGASFELSTPLCLPTLVCFAPVISGAMPSVRYGAEWSAVFSVDASETVSSATQTSAMVSAHILPEQFGTCYRQVEQLERSVPIVTTSACGVSTVLGDAVLTDWTFGFDVATGPSCPPPTHLPHGG